MSKKDEAIRAAVEALEKCRIVAVPSGKDVSPRFVTEALSLLRSAMEEGEEPVAWYHQHVMKVSNGIVESWLSFDQNDEPDLKTEPGASFVVRTPLYASPIAADTKDKQ